jgi:CO/xanthine dehydrogenase FAD-binding subunit
LDPGWLDEALLKPAPFDYRAPDSLDDALEILKSVGGDGKLLAGGQSLVPAMNFRLIQPALLIDLNGLRELQYIQETDGGVLRIGAMTRERELERDARIASSVPLLAEAMPNIAHPQIRNRGTLGGSLANADPAAELPVIMVAVGARFKLRSTKGERWVAASDFFTGLFSTALAEDEMLVEVEIPSSPPRTGWSFMEMAPRSGDYALMGVAALITLDDRGKCTAAALVFLNAGEGPVRALRSAQLLLGNAIDEENAELAAAMASNEEIQPFGNVHASPEYQRHLAHVLARRALLIAADRAASGALL